MSAYRIPVLLFLLVIGLSVMAQGVFKVEGRLKIEAGDLRNARMVMYKDGVKERTVTTDLSRFTLSLDIGHKYILEFQKDGYVTKKLLFNTEAPAEAVANGFTPFEFGVSLFKQYDDVNIVIFNQPVGIIRYESSIDDFDYDTDYTKSIQSQLDEATERTVAKEKDLEKQNKEEEKREAQEAKAQAKEEARAAKEREAAEAKAAEEARKARMAEEKAEEERKAPEPGPVEKVEPPPPAPVAPVAREEAPPVKRTVPPPTPVEQNGMSAKATAGEDGRRSIEARMGEEEVRMAKARNKVDEEIAPVVETVVPEQSRTEDLIVETNKVETVIVLTNGAEKHEYRRVAHKWGGVFFFKDGAAVSRDLYEREALADRMVQAGE